MEPIFFFAALFGVILLAKTVGAPSYATLMQKGIPARGVLLKVSIVPSGTAVGRASSGSSGAT